MKNRLNHLWSIAQGEYGTSYVYRFILALLFVFMGTFSSIVRNQSLPLFLFNLSLIGVGILYFLIIFDKIKTYKTRVMVEFLSLLPLVVNLGLSIFELNDTVDSISYGVFAIVVLMFSWRAEGADNVREINR